MAGKWIGTVIFFVGALFLGIGNALATVQLAGEEFTVTGFLRYEFALHTGPRNPANVFQTENNEVQFSRFWLQAEWNYEPYEKLRIFAKTRAFWDQTQGLESDLEPSYDAFPIDVPSGDWTMLEASGRDARAEIWELYTDMDIGNLWLRLGKQQIVWGEMIASQILDIIHPLNMSQNLKFEPEEFENIRIPTWMIRGIYKFEKVLGSIDESTFEFFVNPGDVLPTQVAEQGSPMVQSPPFPSNFRIDWKDRRGDFEYGFRIGGMIGGLFMTLNYLHLYDDGGLFELDYASPTPAGVLLYLDREYDPMDIYGLGMNYFVAPLNTVVTFEGTWTPDRPYGDAVKFSRRDVGITDVGTFDMAIRLDRPTQVLPAKFLQANFMVIQPQFNLTLREGDTDKALGPGNSKLDSTDASLSLNISQKLLYNTWALGFLIVHDLDGATYLKPSIKHLRGDHMIFDLYSVFFGGSETRPGRFGSFETYEEVVFRVSYQF